MKQEVVDYVVRVCKRLGLNANYLADDDLYFIHKNGRAIQGFTTWQFYSIPKRAREQEFLPLLKIGLANNLAERYHDQVFMRLKYGKKLI